jgi:hypothetical protein
MLLQLPPGFNGIIEVKLAVAKLSLELLVFLTQSILYGIAIDE